MLAEKRAAVEVQIANLRKLSKVLMREQQRLQYRAERNAELGEPGGIAS